MKNIRVFNIVNLTFNLVILLISLAALILLFFDLGFSSFNYFSTWGCLISGAIMVIAISYNCLKEIYKEYKIPYSISALKLLNVTNLMVCFWASLAFVGPNSLIESYFYFPRIVLPALALINFVFFDFAHKMTFKYAIFGVIPVFLYFVVMSLLIIFNVVKPLYTFENIRANAWYITLLFAIIVFLGTFLLGYVINLLNHVFRRLFIGEQYVASGETTIIPKLQLEGEKQAEQLQEESTKKIENDIEDKNNVTNSDEENATNNEEVSNVKPISSYQKKYTSRVYHVSRQKIVGKWQVKLAGSKKPIKYFDTQIEAINFAKGLTKNNGGSIRVHSLTGQMRKN